VKQYIQIKKFRVPILFELFLTKFGKQNLMSNSCLIVMENIKLLAVAVFILVNSLISMAVPPNGNPDSICQHKVILDKDSKILSWMTPQSNAYDQFLHLRWNFVKTRATFSPGPAPRSNYPLYYFYCELKQKDGKIIQSGPMNDIGEKIPNWFENARLYYAYTGDLSVMTIMKNFIDYTIKHGTSASTFAWPNFPYTTANSGDTLFRGYNNSKRLVLHEIQVDHAAEMGLTYYRMYLYDGDKKYLKVAMDVANVLVKNVRTGSATQSPWPYRVVMDSGKIVAEYGANWSGAYMLLDNLIKANLGNVKGYKDACDKIVKFIAEFPMKTGYWTDGHSDTDVNSNTYKSNLSNSNAVLCLYDYPDFNPEWKTNIPKMIKWTEDYFIFRTAKEEPSTVWGANIVGEQDGFNFKMDYQTARYGAECARWYAISGDESYKDKAFRSLNWVTYCNDATGFVFESPVSKGIQSWWSDCYGECPRMFYQAFAAIPEWAPPAQNHILYSEGILTNVAYAAKGVNYTATAKNGTEFLRLAFKPENITLNGAKISLGSDPNKQGYILKDLGNGDYSVKIYRFKTGKVVVK